MDRLAGSESIIDPSTLQAHFPWTIDLTFTSLILVFIGILVFLIFRKDWKKCVYFLIFMLPFFGYIQHKIYFLV